MYNIMIWGTGDWANRLMKSLPANCNILKFIETKKTKDSFLGIPVIDINELQKKHELCDYVIVATIYRSEIIGRLKKEKISIKNYFFVTEVIPDIIIIDYENTFQYKIQELFLEKREIYKYEQRLMDYTYCECEDVKYLVNSRYRIMIQELMKESYQSEDIELFIKLAETYYQVPSDVDGVFVDVGANIGTTSIWVKKKLNSRLRILAFEPSRENIKQYKINSILNEVEEDITLVHAAVTDGSGTAELMLSEDNLGDNRILKSSNEVVERNRESVSTISLDQYLEAHPEIEKEICYVWMDIQGHEAFAIKGGMKFLKENEVPLYIEFWPEQLEKNSSLELLIQELQELYHGFICVSKYKSGDTKVYPIDALDDLAREYQEDSCDIFLVKHY